MKKLLQPSVSNYNNYYKSKDSAKERHQVHYNFCSFAKITFCIINMIFLLKYSNSFIFNHQKSFILYRGLTSKISEQLTSFPTHNNKNNDNPDLVEKNEPIQRPSSSLWQGELAPFSDWAMHIRIGKDDAPTTVEQALHDSINVPLHPQNEPVTINATTFHPLTCQQLLYLGAVWYQRESTVGNQYIKPKRLSLVNATDILQGGDYMRVHFRPRRFPEVYNHYWGYSGENDSNKNNTDNKPSVIVAVDKEKGYVVIDKPPSIPVHGMVDNALENCLHHIHLATSEPYVKAAHRLDINTSGLLAVAIQKPFARYFADMLKIKTNLELDKDVEPTKQPIKKGYRCLVCLIAPDEDDFDGNDNKENNTNNWSVVNAMKKLQSFATNGTVLRHYLEKSDLSPKVFSSVPNDEWLECLMKLQNVGEVCPVVGTKAGQQLVQSLWGADKTSIPERLQAVVEVEIELLTGRTHQIRGQLSVEGFPLVGDIQYGGANPTNYALFLALQCCRLDFLDPSFDDDKNYFLPPEPKVNRFKLDESWWTPLIKKFRKEVTQEIGATTGKQDQELVEQILQHSKNDNNNDNYDISARPDLLPPQVSLSPGKQKYVMVMATNPKDSADIRYFVKSASPSECGGPYHANVATELVEWIQSAGYQTVVTGGGRIDYQQSNEHAIVYGFSYGFGRGDHELAAKIIQDSTNGTISATFDNSKEVY